MKLQTLLENAPSATKFLKSKKLIENWLKKYEVKNYEINEDLTVSLFSPLRIIRKRLKTIPIKFKDSKAINVSGNQLASIDWAPEIVDGDFKCNDNKIVTLEGGPREVKGTFNCAWNLLTSLKGGPIEVHDFLCISNKLTNLIGSPQKVGGDFTCAYGTLKSIEGIAQTFNGVVNLTGNKIESIDFLPRSIKIGLYLDKNEIMSVRGIYKTLKQMNNANDETFGIISFEKNPIEKGLISLMGIKGIKQLDAASNEEGELKKAVDIINNSIKNNIDAFATQKLLADAGLMKYS